MKKLIYLVLIIILSSYTVKAQDTISDEEKLQPVEYDWEASKFIDNQTTYTPMKKGKEFLILHRFSGFGNGVKDLFGFYGASNILLGINYGITNNLMIGFGSEKDRKYQEFSAKYRILQQNKGGSIPLSLAVYGNVCLNAREKEFWGADYKFIDRLSYFGQVIGSRKISDNFSLMLAGSYSHINKVDNSEIITPVETYNMNKNNAVGLSAGCRYKFYREISLIAEYDQGFYIGDIKHEQEQPKPNLALGFQFNTGTHTFQLFASSYRGIVPQQNFILNRVDIERISEYMIGFNINIRL